MRNIYKKTISLLLTFMLLNATIASAGTLEQQNIQTKEWVLLTPVIAPPPTGAGPTTSTGTPLDVIIYLLSIAMSAGITTINAVTNCIDANDDMYQTMQVKLPRIFEENTSVEIINADGQAIQRRYYGNGGKATLDIDLTDHGNKKKHNFKDDVHKHSWSNVEGQDKPVRSTEPEELTSYEYFKYIIVPKYVSKTIIDEIALDDNNQ